MVTIADPEVFVCHFAMFVVGVGPVPFLSLREENSYFEEEMATTFWEEQLVNTHFCQRLVSIFSEFHF